MYSLIGHPDTSSGTWELNGVWPVILIWAWYTTQSLFLLSPKLVISIFLSWFWGIMMIGCYLISVVFHWFSTMLKPTDVFCQVGPVSMIQWYNTQVSHWGNPISSFPVNLWLHFLFDIGHLQARSSNRRCKVIDYVTLKITSWPVTPVNHLL